MHDDFSEFLLSSKAKSQVMNKNLLKQELVEGKNAQELLGFTFETMAKFYRAAYQLFEQHLYIDAANAFLFLATLNSHHHDYWLGLGMSLQLCHEYEPAIDAYELAALCDIESPVPYFYLAKCLFAIHDRESSLQALELAIETAGDIEEYSELKRQAQMAKQILLEDGI